MNMRPRFVIVNVTVVALGVAAWLSGWFDGFVGLHRAEWAMLAFLAAYFAVGLRAAWHCDWTLARHIANGLPMWALGFTGLGLVMAVSGLTALTPDALATVFKNLVLAIVPNFVGVLLLVWLREIAHWCGGEEI